MSSVKYHPVRDALLQERQQKNDGEQHETHRCGQAEVVIDECGLVHQEGVCSSGKGGPAGATMGSTCHRVDL